MSDKEVLLHDTFEVDLDSGNSEEEFKFPLKDVIGGSEGNQEVTIDEFLHRTGECGRYQVFVIFLICITLIPMCFPPMIFYFIGYDPPWTCERNVSHSNSSFCATSNKSLVFEHTLKQRCNLERNEWSFANHGRSTLVTEFNLVCNDAWLDALAGSIVFIGWGIGILTLGYLSDQYGRKKIMYPALFLTLMALMAHAFVTKMWQLIVIRFIMGFTYSGPAINGYILSLELVGATKRVLASTIVNLTWPFGALVMTLQAYYIKNWRYLALATSIPYILGIFTFICVPESVRWLSIKGKIKEAERVLHKAADRNKQQSQYLSLKMPGSNKNSNSSYLVLFKNCKIFRLMFAQAIMWFNSGMVYYALSWAFSDLGGDIYVNFILSTLIEIPGIILIYFLLESFGRKKTTICMSLLTSIFCLCVAFIPKQHSLKNIRVTFGLLAKLTMSGALCCNYIWSTEIYATSIRTQGMGINIVTSRLGAAMSPFIKILNRFHPATPFVLMAVSSLISTIICLVLPETHQRPTRETVEDMLEDEKPLQVKARFSPTNGNVKLEAANESPLNAMEEEEGEEESDRLLSPPQSPNGEIRA